MPRRKQTTALKLKDLGPGTRLYAYCRDSGGTNQDKSVNDQRAAIEQYAAEHGWTVIGWYVDEAISAGDYDARLQFEALLDACRRDPPPVDAVICWNQSRFGRDELDSQFYRLELRRRGVDVISVANPVPAGPFATIFEAFIDWKNRVFLDDMSADVRRGLRANVTAGYAPGGRPPTGYQAARVTIGTRRNGAPHVVAQWIIDPETGPRVTQAFHMLAAGRSYRDIHEAVHLLRGKASYQCMFRNRTYLGIYKLGAEEFPGPPPLVDEATFAAVQARIGSRQEAARRARRVNSLYLLSGLAVCGECGALMIGGSDRRNEKRGYRSWRHYRCGRQHRLGAEACPTQYIGCDRVDQVVVNAVLDKVLTPVNIRRLLDELRAALQDPELDRAAERLDAEIARLRRSVGNLLDAIEDGTGGIAARERLREREAGLAQALAQRAELEKRRELAKLTVTESDLAGLLAAIRSQVAADDVPTARRALASCVAKVELWPDRLVIHYHDPIGPQLLGFETMPPRGTIPKPSQRLECLLRAAPG